jgi:hypothetical protein|tara:strand:+ start:29 stop:340 length:312 start_codon:yes stop_codon:yes gene_type:complete
VAKKRPTKEQRDMMNKMVRYGCVACHKDNIYSEAEIHHIRNHTGLGLRDHDKILPLCPKHHRYGKISIHLGKKAFIEKYGTEEQLAKQVRERIEEWDIITSIF